MTYQVAAAVRNVSDTAAGAAVRKKSSNDFERLEHAANTIIWVACHMLAGHHRIEHLPQKSYKDEGWQGGICCKTKCLLHYQC